MKTIKLTNDDIKPMIKFIADQWPNLTTMCDGKQSTLIQLPNEYIKPSIDEGHFRFKEQYYWDSYFIIIGLNDEKLVTGMLDNLVSLYEEFQIIPNANRYYFTGRSQPPLLTSLILHIYHKYKKSKKWLQTYMKTALSEYETVWTSTEHPHARNVHGGLSRYYDVNNLHDLAEAESGWDMTSRFERRCLDFLPIDLNCMLYKYEMDFAKTFELLGNKQKAKAWEDKASERKSQINSLMWNERKGFYYDYDYFNDKIGTVQSLAAYFALWSGVADHVQADRLVNNLKQFKYKGGLTVTTKSLLKIGSRSSQKTQWDYPNGWAPMHIIVCDGLEKYGIHAEAKNIALRWINTCNNWYTSHQEMVEKYNVVYPNLDPTSGVYPTQHGFGWTNSSVVYLASKYIK